ncbi:MAG: hypothetical protein WC657_00325 [Candidatus Paceibacterota bacterium]
MKNKTSILFLALSVMFLTGCVAARGGAGWGRLSSIATPPILTVVLTNNTTVPIEVYENGQVVAFKTTTGQFVNAIIPSGVTVSRGYYNFLGRRDIVITARGICPPTPSEADRKSAGCQPGQYAGTASRRFTIRTDGRWHTEAWEINYLRGPRGVS